MNAREGSSSAMTSTSSTRVRWNPTKEQLRILENVYNGGNRSPRTEQIQHITAELRRHGNVAGINVFYWFKNRKARERRRMKTSLAPDNSSQIANCESNKGCMGSLSEMNCYMKMDYGGHNHGYLNTNNVSHSNESVMDHHEDQDRNMYSEMSPWWMDCSSSSSREVHAHHETLQLFPPP